MPDTEDAYPHCVGAHITTFADMVIVIINT